MNDLLAVLHAAEAGEWHTIDELRLRLRWTRRDVEAGLESLRLAGEPIVAGPDGVRLTTDPDELDAYLKARGRRAGHIHLGTMRMRSTLRRMREARDLTLWGAA